MRNPYFSLLGSAWRYAREDRKLYVIIYVMFFCANIIAAVNPFFYGWFVNSIQKNGLSVHSTVWLYALGFLALKLLEWAFHGPARVMERKLAFKISQNYLDDLYGKLIYLPVDWHKNHHSGATINRLRKSYSALKEFFQSGFIYVQSLLKFIISFAVMFYFSPLFGCVAAVLGFITLLVIVKFDKPFITALKQVNEADHEVSSNLTDSLSNILTVITLRLEKRVHAGLTEKVNAVFPPFKKFVAINEWKWFTAQMLVALIYVVMIVGYVYQHTQPGKVFMLGGLVTLLGFVNQFTSVFNDFAAQYTQIVQFHTDVESSNHIADASGRDSQILLQKALPADWHKITIAHLNYSHQKTSHLPVSANTNTIKKAHALDDINMVLARGKRIALIGESGCGKSTLLSLLRGLQEPEQKPVMEVDGNKYVNFAEMADEVTLFPQEPEIFEATFEYNITLGMEYNQEEVHRVCAITRLSPVLENLELGSSTMIQEKGVNLSGGQKQRLALARGVLAAQNSSIVLLDEPTSNMDPKTEREIYLNLFEEFEGKTVISTLHRLHLLEHFDYIYVMHQGKIAEQGSLGFLIENGKLFNKLWSHQQKTAEEHKVQNEYYD
jgi:ABC-type bacteriocin/lantibiotic exporter with double-glycine peptidase domain